MTKQEIIGPNKIYKPVSTLAMVPKTGAITRVGRQAYNIMMMLSREQGTEDEKTGLFSAPLNTVIRGFDGSLGTFDDLKRHLRSMVSHVVEWQSPSPGEVEEWGACALLSQVSTKKRENGELWISWAYPPAIRQEMMSPLRFAQIQRSTIAQFRTHAGLALYEICARYKNNPSHRTSKQHWHWWLPVLTGKPAPKEIKTQFRFFNRDTLKPAIEEVNEVSELTVSVIEFKVGRTIEMIQFEVQRKSSETNLRSSPFNFEMLQRANILGIDQEVAEDLYFRHGEVKFAMALERLSMRLRLSKSPPIGSLHAYFKSLFGNQAMNDDAAEVQTKAESTTSKNDSPPKANPTFESQVKLEAAERELISTLRREISELRDIQPLLSELKTSLVSKNASPSVIKRLDEGKWESPLVMNELIRFYWQKTRGTDWSSAAVQSPAVTASEPA